MIKRLEGFAPRARPLSDGRYLVGYGHVKSTRRGVRITRADAEMLLIFDLSRIEKAINSCLATPLNSNQYDALVSFVHNVTPSKFLDSWVLECLNKGDHIAAANAMAAWRLGHTRGRLQVVDALVRRRAIEMSRFLEPVGREWHATSAVHRPVEDIEWRSNAPISAKVDSALGDRNLVEPVDSVKSRKRSRSDSVNSDEGLIEQAARRTLSQIEQSIPSISGVVKTRRERVEPSEPAQVQSETNKTDALKERINRLLDREEKIAKSVPENNEKIITPEDVARAVSNTDFKSIEPGGQSLIRNQAVETRNDQGQTKDSTKIAAQKTDVLPQLSQLLEEIEDEADSGPDRLQEFETHSEDSQDQEFSPNAGTAEVLDIPDPIEDVTKTEVPPAKQVESNKPLTQNAAKGNVASVFDVPAQSAQRSGAHRSSANWQRWLWGVVFLVSVCLVCWGVFSFWDASNATENVTRAEAGFGPALIGVGLVSSAISLYFIIASLWGADA